MKYGRLLKGPVMLTPACSSTSRSVEMESDSRRSESKDLMRIPARSEAQHIELMGDTGAGKDNSHHAGTPPDRRAGAHRNRLRPGVRVHPAFLPARTLRHRSEPSGSAVSVLGAVPKNCGAKPKRRRSPSLSTSRLIPREMSSSPRLRRRSLPIFSAPGRRLGSSRIGWQTRSEIDKQVRGTEMATMIAKDSPPQRNGVLSSLGLVADSLQYAAHS